MSQENKAKSSRTRQIAILLWPPNAYATRVQKFIHSFSEEKKSIGSRILYTATARWHHYYLPSGHSKDSHSRSHVHPVLRVGSNLPPKASCPLRSPGFSLHYSSLAVTQAFSGLGWGKNFLQGYSKPAWQLKGPNWETGTAGDQTLCRSESP